MSPPVVRLLLAAPLFALTVRFPASAQSPEGNRPPVAMLHAPPGPVSARSPVALSCTASDPDGDTLTVVWDFGNGRTATGPAVTWSFLTGGTKSISVQVSDGNGGVAETSASIQVSDPLGEFEEIADPVQTSDGAFLNGAFVAVGSGGSLHSVDGTVWKQGARWYNPDYSRVAAGNGRFVATLSEAEDFNDATAVTRVSLDGSEWSEPQSHNVPPVTELIYHAGQFVGVGPKGAILSSPEGILWSVRTVPGEPPLFHPPWLSGIAPASSGGFVTAGAAAYTSRDGIHWERQSSDGPGQELASDGERLLGIDGGSSRFKRSDDGGLNWTEQPFDLQPEFTPWTIAFGDGIWFAAAIQQQKMRIAVSANAAHWEELPPHTVPRPASTFKIRVLDHRLFVFGIGDRILRSGPIPPGAAPLLDIVPPASPMARMPVTLQAIASDAEGGSVSLGWDTGSTGFSQGNPASVEFLAGGNQTVTAFASDGEGGRNALTKEILVDDPLLFWKDVTPEFIKQGRGYPLAAGPERMVAIGANSVFTVPAGEIGNPAAWSESQTPSGQFYYKGYNSVTWGSHGFVAAGYGYDAFDQESKAITAHSPDGLTWSEPTALSGHMLKTVTASSEGYVTLGDEDEISFSPDGINWVSVGPTTRRFYRRMDFIGRHGFITGNFEALRSNDGGRTWTEADPALPLSWSIGTAGGRLWTVEGHYAHSFDPVTDTVETFTQPGPERSAWDAITTHEGIFLATKSGYVGTPPRDTQKLFVSTNGSEWGTAELPRGWQAELRDFHRLGNQLLAENWTGLFLLTVPTPGLSVNPPTCSFLRGTNETGTLGPLTIINTGFGTADWTVSTDSPWLGSSLRAGSATVYPTDFQSLLVSPLPAGIHTGTLTFSAPGLAPQSVIITVNCVVDDHGGSPESATRLALDGTAHGTILPDGDEDWFRLEVPVAGSLKISGEGDPWTSNMQLWNGDTLEALVRTHGVSPWVIQKTLRPGSYLLKITTPPTDRPREYRLTTSFVANNTPLEVLSIAPLEGGLRWRMEVLAPEGFVVQVESSSDLNGPWNPLGETASTYGSPQYLTVDRPLNTQDRLFFRAALIR